MTVMTPPETSVVSVWETDRPAGSDTVRVSV